MISYFYLFINSTIRENQELQESFRGTPLNAVKNALIDSLKDQMDFFGDSEDSVADIKRAIKLIKSARDGIAIRDALISSGLEDEDAGVIFFKAIVK